MDEIRNSFVRSVRPSCPKCNTPSLIGELHTKSDGSKITICSHCNTHIRIKLVPKEDGVHVQTTEILE